MYEILSGRVDAFDSVPASVMAACLMRLNLQPRLTKVRLRGEPIQALILPLEKNLGLSSSPANN